MVPFCTRLLVPFYLRVSIVRRRLYWIKKRRYQKDGHYGYNGHPMPPSSLAHSQRVSTVVPYAMLDTSVLDDAELKGAEWGNTMAST
jgi:hypothetical protein